MHITYIKIILTVLTIYAHRRLIAQAFARTHTNMSNCEIMTD